MNWGRRRKERIGSCDSGNTDRPRGHRRIVDRSGGDCGNGEADFCSCRLPAYKLYVGQADVPPVSVTGAGVPVGVRYSVDFHQPTWDEIGKLAATAVIRTALKHFLSREMQEFADRQKREESGSPLPVYVSEPQM